MGIEGYSEMSKSALWGTIGWLDPGHLGESTGPAAGLDSGR
jgi:hypothetical protein